MAELSLRDRRCYALVGYASKGTSYRRANLALNEFVADPRRGLVLFHDHFVDKAGGLAIFAVETQEELAALQEPGPLNGWDLRIHPLTFADSPVRFLYQIDFTMTAYRKKRLKGLMAEYEASELARKMDQQATEI